MFMKDLTNPKLMWCKAGLFVVLGMSAALLIFLEAPSWKLASLLALTIWAFCRAYYFAFYVIEHYIDPNYRFAGLISFFRHLLRNR